MKSPELSNGEKLKTASLYDNFCKTGNYVIYDIMHKQGEENVAVCTD